MSELRKKNESGKISITGLPYDGGSTFLKGPAEAPKFIRTALHSPSSNMWTESGINLGEKGVFTDLGDVEFKLSENPFSKIEDAASFALEKTSVPIFLGGDHSVTYPLIKAFARRFEKLNVLHFDAHPDLYDEFEGNRYSNASPFARIMEEKLIGDLVQIGIRTMNDHQQRQAEKFGVQVVEMRDISNMSVNFPGSPLYISFDMDALDPAFAPGVSHHEPGGLSTRQVIDIIHSLRAEIVGADIVELNPGRDPVGITAMAAAKLLKEIMGKSIDERLRKKTHSDH